MILSLFIPNFWIAIEELRCPELRERPVVIGDSFLSKRGGNAQVIMSNEVAATFGVRPGISLAHARQLCPEAVFLSPEAHLYRGVWDEIIGLLLVYTPLVESIAPGEALCDVAGSERLFGDPVALAVDIIGQVASSFSLQATAGVATNRLVAELASRQGAAGSPTYIPPGREAIFLSSFPVTVLPDLDPDTLLTFQVLGIKTVQDLRRIPVKAMTSRFGELGSQLAAFAHGRDSRLITPAQKTPSLSVSRYVNDERFDGLEPDPLLAILTKTLAIDLSQALQEERKAGRFLRLIVRTPKPELRQPQRAGRQERNERRLHLVSSAAEPKKTEPVPAEQFFPNQDSRIHSMLPQPKQPGRTRYLDPMPGTKSNNLNDESLSKGHPAMEQADYGESGRETEPGVVIRAVVQTALPGSVWEPRTLAEITERLIHRVMRQVQEAEPRIDSSNGFLSKKHGCPSSHYAGCTRFLMESGLEFVLEISQFVPPEQLTLPGIDDRPANGRMARLERQEKVLTARFGISPFRHVESLNLDSVLSEKMFRWGDGLAG